jgi:hypothetical protein
MTKIIAHKGGRFWTGDYIEESIRLGADIIELDILEKDGKYRVKHPLGIPFYDKRVFFPNQGNLGNFLLKINNRADLYLDIKDKSIDPVKLLDFVRKYHQKGIIVGSFNTSVLSRFRKADKGIVINLHCLPLKRNILLAKKIGANWINPIPLGIRKSFVIEAKRANLKFVPAGQDRFNQIKRYIALGAYAISLYDIKKFKEFLK